MIFTSSLFFPLKDRSRLYQYCTLTATAVIMNVTIIINQVEFTLKFFENYSVREMKTQIRQITGRKEEEQVLFYGDRVMDDGEVVTMQMAMDGPFSVYITQVSATIMPEAVVISADTEATDTIESRTHYNQARPASLTDSKEKKLIVPATIAIQPPATTEPQRRVVRNIPGPEPPSRDMIRRAQEETDLRQRPPFTISNIQLISSNPEKRYVQFSFDWDEYNLTTSTRFWSKITTNLPNRLRMGLNAADWTNESVSNLSVFLYIYKSFLGCVYDLHSISVCTFPLQIDGASLIDPTDYAGTINYRSSSQEEGKTAEIRFTIAFDTEIPFRR